MSGSKCKVCTSVVVRGATRCGQCGSKHGIPVLHVLFLAASFGLITAMFVLVGRGPNPSELEYHPPRQQPPASDLELAPSLSSPPRPGRW